MPITVDPLLMPVGVTPVRAFRPTEGVLRTRAIIHRRSQGAFALIDQNPSAFAHPRSFAVARCRPSLGSLSNKASFASYPYSKDFPLEQRRKNLANRNPASHKMSANLSEGQYVEQQSKLFAKDKKELLKIYEGKFVLYENGKVLDEGDSRIEIVKRAYKKFGKVKPLFIEKVSTEQETVYKSMSPLAIKDSTDSD